MRGNSAIAPAPGELGAPWLLDPPLGETETAIMASVHRFAAEVLRPIGRELDRMTPEEVVAKGSPFYTAQKKFHELGVSPELFAELPPHNAAMLQSMIQEEYGWGDAGLAISFGVNAFPPFIARALGRADLVERFPGTKLGCWALTEPDHGSDTLDPTRQVFASEGKYGRPGCYARREGDEVVLNGQKSAWVSNGAVAEQSVLFCAYETSENEFRGCVLFVPLDAKGVSRGKPLDKLGQRALPQGEIFFDNVRLPLSCLAIEPGLYAEVLYRTLTAANGGMGSIFAGVARAAFEHALDYAHERRQGGVPIIRHQNVRARLFQMFRKVEAARSLARRVMLHNATAPRPWIHGAMATKVTSTQTAFEVASEALQMFGGAGVTREYPMEKLLRDARASMIEDGCNEFLSIKGGSQLVDYSRLES